ncbi:cysteine-rich receptor-like protein kinase 25 [Phaseolus vulgaris]|uniref:cysteine-rich receptor-like protein kinase 25 n=1 Tax=Phaseolus vulgaris TaxID=3885 RepID=UPI0035CB8BD7
MIIFNSNCFISFLLLSLLGSLTPLTSATPKYNDIYCPKNASYQSNTTTFQTNLNVLFASLTSNATQGVVSYTTTMGFGSTNAVNGLFLCRADLFSATSNDCVATAVTEIRRRCPNQTESIIWYDECMVRYTDRYFSPTSVVPRANLWDDKNISTSDWGSFNQTLSSLLSGLATKAAGSQSASKFAIGEMNFTATSRVYGLAQCASGMTNAQCEACLVNASITLGTCCQGKQGARALLAWCDIRYDLYQFYNTSIASSPVPSPPPPPSEKKKSGSQRTIIIVVVAVAATILVFSGGYFLVRRSRRNYKTLLKENFGDDSATLESLQFSLATIEVATKKFSYENKIGRGGFGEVYKGILLDGRHIAVKKLSHTSRQGVLEFKNEILLIAKLQHRNLVTLIGFCLENQEKILIYEYVPNRSLDYFLFDSHKTRLLSWIERYKIIQGIAQGILYLHDHSRLKVIHRDLKSSNVLLDNNMNPKISDFGIARIIALEQDQGSTNRIVGTYGYMSPEYAMHGQFSEKSDVYSYGVIVLEIISSKKNSCSLLSDDVDDLLSDAWRYWRDETPLKILDQNIEESSNHNEVLKCIQIGLLCVQDKHNDRPTMAEVISYLSNPSVDLPYPGEPTNTVHKKILKKMVAGEFSTSSTFINEISSSIEQSSTPSLHS